MGNHKQPVFADTLVDLVRGRAQQQPDQTIYTFLIDGESAEQRLTYAELDQQARAIGALLQATMAPGARALLLYPPGLEYITAFFGCLYAGVVAVPAYPPHPARLERTFPRLHAMVVDAEPVVALTTAALLPIAEALFAQNADMQGLSWRATDSGVAGLDAAWHALQIEDTTLAFLQYTSGSTATPKGVMLTHANLLHNSSLIQGYFGHSRASCGVIWLPPYHDMGLIGGIIQPLYTGFPVVLMSPVDFLQRPFRWLQAISKYRATTSGGPNFAYDLCARKITEEQRASLDLASWEVAFSGAEPIRPQTLDRFVATFSPCGFRRTAFYPCYGLAEATLIVSGGAKAEPPLVRAFKAEALKHNQAVEATALDAARHLLVGCGRSSAEQQVEIVDPQSLTRCSEGQIGEIWLRGPSVARGYWRREEQTCQVFHASLADTGEGPFLRTGDLGCLIDSELFVTGRLKDLIIIRGVNYYPQDIEQTVERSHTALRPGCGAAFTIEVDGEERLVVAQELDRQQRQADPDDVARAIREAVAREHELQVYAVLLLKTGSIPKTSSGKIQRHACRAGLLENTLEVQAGSVLETPQTGEDALLDVAMLHSLPAGEREQALIAYLRAQIASALRVDSGLVDPQLPLNTLGLDSLMAIELAHTLETTLDLPLPITSLLDGATIAELAAALQARLDAPARASLTPAAASDAEDTPLSHGQRAMWFMHWLAPESAAYTIANAVRIQGALDGAALQRAFQRILDRHPALRTTFLTPADEPIAVIQEHARVDFRIVEASKWGEAALRERLLDEAYRPFDLEHGPLVRVRLFRRTAEEAVLLFAVHHIAADFWSLGIIVDELRQLYAAERLGSVLELPLPNSEYADYTRRQLKLLGGPAGERLWRYWQQQFGDEPPPLNLPTDYPRPPAQTYRGAAHAFRLAPEPAEQMKALARREGATLYTLLLAGLHVLLHRYTGQDDITVGSPMTGRTRDAFAGVVGYFVNPVVLRGDLSGNPPFTTFLKQLRSTVLAALDHKDYPFSLLVDRLQLQRDPSYAPLFQVMFVFQQEHSPDGIELSAFALGSSEARMPFDDLRLEAMALEQRAAQFDLTLTAAEIDGSIAGLLQYRTDLFEATTIARMAGHLHTLLAGIVACPGRPLGALPLLTPAEQAQLLVEWNIPSRMEDGGWRMASRIHPDGDSRSSILHPQVDTCIHTLFEAQAERTPDAVALCWRDQRLSYRELNTRANQLAHYLRGQGVGPESLVGLCLERTPELVVGALGILKAGGAYVPLDPSYPAERVAFMLEDSRASVLITKKEIRDWRLEISDSDQSLISSLQSPTTIYLDADWPTIARTPDTNPETGVTSANLAYVIYTSGSTGRPKGIAIEHRSAVGLLQWAMSIFTIKELAGVLASTSICFDLSVFELFVPLSWGGCVILARDALQLPVLPAAGQVTLINTVPSAIAELVRSGGIPTSVRTVNLAGEPLPHSLAQQVYQQTAIARLFNLYGPTEDTTYSTFALVRKGAQETPSIGRPIDNSHVYLLDRYGQPVPLGVVGEIYIGGAGLARGYLGRPDLTAERFVPNPFAGIEDRGWRMEDSSADASEMSSSFPEAEDRESKIANNSFDADHKRSSSLHPPSSSRLYRTGDLARYRPDGTIEFLGRVDHQVKLRGFRIELGEIESVLRQHPDIIETIVVAREVAPGDPRLVAYIVPTTDSRDKVTRRQGDKVTEAVQEITLSPLHPFTVSGPEVAGELRAFLKEKLPDYMVPALFVVLDALPLTPNGKVDRRALPDITTDRRALATTFVAPASAVEETLVGIWQVVLGIEQIGRHDNFFALGGHSLLMTRVVSRIREAFQVELPLHSLFEDPTIAGIARLIERNTALMHQVDARSIQPHGEDRTTFPLSFAQQRLWFLDQWEPGNPGYTIPCAIRLSGPLRVPVLERCFAEVIRRHEVLRTTFISREGEPVQVVHETMEVPLTIVEVRGVSAAEREARVFELAVAEARQPFDLARGPLLRTTLLRIDHHEHVLLVTMHHIVSDGWSLGVLVQELAALYDACLKGPAAQLPPLPIQYADFACWQRDWLQGELLERQRAYWLGQLQGSPPVLELPADFPRPAVHTFSGARSPLNLPPELPARLTALARGEGATLFMVLLAAFKVLLWRYTRQDDLLVGTPIANRNRVEIEGLIGFFVNTLVLRTDLSGNLTFRELLARVRQVTLSAYTHQDMPFEKLVELLRCERNPSHNPLVQVLFVLQNAPLPALTLPDLRLELLDIDNRTTKFDLLLNMQETPGGFTSWFEYNTALFLPATLARMAGHFQTILEAIVAGPDQQIAELPLLTGPERRQILEDWNATWGELPLPAPADTQQPGIYQLFEAQARRTPDAVAVVFGDAQLSYAELNRRANQVAHYLRRLGIGPDQCAGICMERSLALAITVLGVLKAGGAYVPLDPAYPQERLAFMLADSQARVLIQKEIRDWRLEINGSEQSLISNLQSPLTIELDHDWPTIAQMPETNLDYGVGPDNLAYAIYTSGSTGRPKGVAMRQGALCNLIAWQIAAWPEPARTLQFASFSFDVSFQEFFTTWCSGGTLVLISEQQRRDLGRLPAWLQQAAIERAFFPPVLLQHLADMLDQSASVPTTLRQIITAGEQLRITPSIAKLLARLGGCALHNHYGPSESHVVTEHILAGVPSTWPAGPPIGRPIANTAIYLLDRALQPVPIGVPGELYIGGAGLARGYLNRPDLTAERFIPNPFERLEIRDWRLGGADEEISNLQSLISIGTRLYKTGDLARYREDGTIEFLERIDQQVKLRGFRIEPGEIEAILAGHPGVGQAVVVVREDIPGDRQLVAYVVPTTGDRRPMTDDPRDKVTRRQGDKVMDSEEAISVSPLHPVTVSGEPVVGGQWSVVGELRAFLKDRLPDYMIPSRFVLLERLPLSSNGKVDRRALPAPDRSRRDLDTTFVAPQNPVEQALAAIWSELLGLDQIGIHDNFFAMGGHSLLMTQVMARIRDAFRVDISLRQLFEIPTIAQLAIAIEQAQRTESAALRPAVVPIARERHRVKRSNLTIEENA